MILDPLSESKENILVHELNDYLDPLGNFPSTKKVMSSLLYRSLEVEIDRVVNGLEYGFYAPPLPLVKKPFYRVVAWNLERGKEYDGILKALKTDPQLASADVYLFTETDSGMARTANRNVARDLAKELGFHYFFAPSYLNLCMGNSVENHITGRNQLGLHGNALLSRYPMENLRIVPLINCKDKMKGKEKRLGQQKALVADIVFPYRTVTMGCAHLDAHSSQRQRAGQMETILKALEKNPFPILLGGDLNTNTYNSSRAFYAFCGFWNKVFRGVDDVIDNHYPYPDRYYDKPIFDVFKKYGMSYESFNELGVGTLHYHVDDLKGNHMVREVVPEWCRKIMENTLRRHGGKVSLKLDWFAARGLKVASKAKGASLPKVLSRIAEDGSVLSDHDPILVDIDIYD